MTARKIDKLIRSRATRYRRAGIAGSMDESRMLAVATVDRDLATIRQAIDARRLAEQTLRRLMDEADVAVTHGGDRRSDRKVTA